MNKRQVVSWCLFDFANSSYSAVITAVVFQVYFINVVVGNSSGQGDLWWGRAISLSMLSVSLTAPFLGGIADFAGRTKMLLAGYTALAVVAVTGFTTLSPGAILPAFFLVILANIGMEGGLVFYNSFLPKIAPPAYQGRLSGWGFGTGYAGSLVALLLALPLARSGSFDLIWILVALFFGIFSLPAFLFLPRDQPARGSMIQSGKKGIVHAWATIRELWRNREARLFLFAYLMYEDGVSTVIGFSSSLASTTFKFGQAELIGLFLAVQLTALAGAFALSGAIDRRGPKYVVLLSLALWILVSVSAFFAQTKTHFWAVACTAGFGLGSVQAASRSFFAQFIPEAREAEYFGVYALVGKSSAIIGPLMFGAISAAAGNQRPAILSVALLFITGFFLLIPVRGGGPNIGRRKPA